MFTILSSSLSRAARSGAFAILGVLVFSAAPAAARTPVDPATLNPEPPDFFNAVCSQVGRQTSCTLAFVDPNPVSDEGSGIVCGSDELHFSQDRSVVGRRWYDADGNLVQRHFRETFAGSFWNPRTGKVASWSQHDTVIHNLSIPGDLGSGTISFTGLITRIQLPGGGTILTDAGTMLINVSTDEIIRESGHHPLDAYFSGADPSALDGLCGALA